MGWLVERQFPTRFSKPEIQISLSNSFNQTVNALSIVIGKEEARVIEAQAEPIRQSVRKMFDAYRPGGRAEGSSGNGERQRTVDVAAVATEVKVLAPITDKEDTPAFWLQFASGSGERSVSKEVAIYAAATIVNEALGRGLGHQAIVSFKSERVTVGDVLSVIDQLCGGPAGWQLLQRKAGVSN
jgi:hypothetical protein